MARTTPLLILPLVGCGVVDIGGVNVVVESNTSWAGDICDAAYCAADYTSHEHRGSGNQTFAGEMGQTCYWFGKTTDSGYVRVYINNTDVLGTTRNAEYETSASHGAVSACWTR